jgi:hypothetical protein
LYISIGRFEPEPEVKELMWGYEPYIFATLCIEAVYVTDIILQFFKEYKPVG